MPSFPVYKIFRCTCAVKGCQEIATLVREPLQARVVGRSPDKESTDSLAMEVVFEGKAYTLTNVYNPPKKDLTLDCAPGVISRTIIGGDFNANSPA